MMHGGTLLGLSIGLLICRFIFQLLLAAGSSKGNESVQFVASIFYWNHWEPVRIEGFYHLHETLLRTRRMPPSFVVSRAAVPSVWEARKPVRRLLTASTATSTTSTASVLTVDRSDTTSSQLGIGIMAGVFIAVGIMGIALLIIYRQAVRDWTTGSHHGDSSVEDSNQPTTHHEFPSHPGHIVPQSEHRPPIVKRRLSAPRSALNKASMFPMADAVQPDEDVGDLPSPDIGDWPPPPPHPKFSDVEEQPAQSDSAMYFTVGNVRTDVSSPSLYGNATSSCANFGSLFDMSAHLFGPGNANGFAAAEGVVHDNARGPAGVDATVQVEAGREAEVVVDAAAAATAPSLSSNADNPATGVSRVQDLIAKMDKGGGSVRHSKAKASSANGETPCTGDDDQQVAGRLSATLETSTLQLNSPSDFQMEQEYDDCFIFAKQIDGVNPCGPSQPASTAEHSSTSQEDTDIYDLPWHSVGTDLQHSTRPGLPAASTKPPQKRPLSPAASAFCSQPFSYACDKNSPLRKTVSEGCSSQLDVSKSKRQSLPAAELATTSDNKSKFRYAVKLTTDQQHRRGAKRFLDVLAQIKRGSKGNVKASVIESVQRVPLNESVGATIPSSTARRSSSFPLNKSTSPTPPAPVDPAVCAKPVLVASIYTTALPRSDQAAPVWHHTDELASEARSTVRRQSLSVPLSSSINCKRSASDKTQPEPAFSRRRLSSTSSLSPRLPSHNLRSGSSSGRAPLAANTAAISGAMPNATFKASNVADEGDLYMDMAFTGLSPAASSIGETIASSLPQPEAAPGVAADEMYGSVEAAEDIYAVAALDPGQQLVMEDEYMCMSAGEN
eukprot:scpid12966/ scgid18275/ 